IGHLVHEPRHGRAADSDRTPVTAVSGLEHPWDYAWGPAWKSWWRARSTGPRHDRWQSRLAWEHHAYPWRPGPRTRRARWRRREKRHGPCPPVPRRIGNPSLGCQEQEEGKEVH